MLYREILGPRVFHGTALASVPWFRGFVLVQDGARKKAGENLWRTLHEMQFPHDHPSTCPLSSTALPWRA